jgi:uncharacterized protein
MKRVSPESYCPPLQPSQESDKVQATALACFQEKHAEAQKYFYESDPASLQKGYTMYKELAEAEYTPGLIDYLFCVCHGLGTEENLFRAHELAQKALSKELTPDERGTVLSVLGITYQAGDLTHGDLNINFKKAMECYLASSRLKNVWGRLCVSKLQVDRNYPLIAEMTIRDAMPTLMALAIKGHACATVSLGLCYHIGLGVDEDAEQGFHCFSEAAKHGYSKAQLQVGMCYEYGWGVQKNLELAREYYQKAADQNHIAAKEALLKRFNTTA